MAKIAQQTKVPSLRVHKASGRAFVELNHRRIYLGPHGEPETQERYHATIAEWIANGRRLPVDPNQVTVTEVCLAYWEHAQEYYRGSKRTLDNIRTVIRDVRELYGRQPAMAFGPLALKAVRRKWVDKKLARRTVNSYTGDVKRIFKWAASNEMIPPSTFHGLQTVDGLRKGRSMAKETGPVLPVPEKHINAVKGHVPRQVWALIQLQVLTGARPGELLTLKRADIDTSGTVWLAKVDNHKTSYLDQSRTLYFGPKAQAVLRDFLVRPNDAYLFSPREAEAERHARAESHRRPNQKPNPPKSTRTVGNHFTTDSYRHAIERGCKKARAPKWTPHRLRHNAATFIRREFGLEAAQVILGHSRADITQVYAERDEAKAIEVIAEVG